MWNRRQFSCEKKWAAWGFPLVAILAGLVLTAAASQFLYRQDLRAIDLETAATADSVATQLQTDLTERLHAVDRLADRWNARGGTPRAEWLREVTNYLRDVPGIYAFSYVGRDGKLRWAQGRENQTNLTGLNVLEASGQGAAFARAEASGRITLSETFPLLGSGAHGFLAVAPVYGSGTLDGFIVAVFELKTLLASLGHSSHHRVALFDQRGRILFDDVRSGHWENARARAVPAPIGDFRWSVRVVPSHERVESLESSLPEIAIAVGLFISLFLGALVRELLARRRAEARFREMVELLPTGAIYVEGGRLYPNAAIEKLTGYPREQFPTLDRWFDTIYGEEGPDVRAYYERLRAEGFPGRPSVQFKRRDGEVRHVEFSAFIAGEMEIWILHDLTDRVLAEEKFRLLFEHSAAPHFFQDPDGGMLDCNPATVRILGAASKDEVIGQHPARFSPEVQPDGTRSKPATEEIAVGIRERGYHRFEWTHARLDGTPFPVEVTVIPIEYRERTVHLVIWHDLTERVAAEEKFRLLFDYSSDAHMIVEKERGLIECNPAMAVMFGADDKKKLIGLSPDQFSPPTQPDGSSSAESALAATRLAFARGFHRFEWQHRRLDGSDFPTFVTLRAVKYQGRDVILACVQDLTEQKTTQAKLLQSSKMSSLGEMAGGLAHELNTPLAVIKGKAELANLILAKGNVDPAVLARHLEGIDTTVDRMAKIIRALRFFARDSGGDPAESSAVTAILDDTLALCRHRFGNHGVSLTVEHTENLYVRCRPVQISQVILNLLNNAFDAMGDQPEKEIRVTASSRNGLVEIAVEDNGPGIPADLRAKIMQPFFTTKEVGKGTGLGLSISTGLAQSNGGRLFLDETCPRTRFVVQLPADVAEAAAEEAAA